MAQGKGGVLGSFVMIEFKKGTAKTFEKTSEKSSEESKKGRKLSPVAYVKEPIAKFFGWQVVTPADMLRLATRTMKMTINGKTQDVKTTVSMGTTGASRSVTVKFKALQNIGGKQVASVKIAMPTSHTFGNMVQEIMESPKSSFIAAIVSPDGKSMIFGTPYNPKTKKA
jgi:hypothetical protein